MGYCSEKDKRYMLRVLEETERLERSWWNAVEDGDIQRQFLIEKEMDKLKERRP